MDVPDSVITRKPEELDETELELLNVGIGCAKALNSMTSSPKIKEELRKHGVMFLIARFLKSEVTDLVVPTMGAVQQCSDIVRAAVMSFSLDFLRFMGDFFLENIQTGLRENGDNLRYSPSPEQRRRQVEGKVCPGDVQVRGEQSVQGHD